MQTIRQQCPQCHASLELPTSAIGRTARCPACQHVFPVQAEATEASPTRPLGGGSETLGGAAPSAGGGYPFSPPPQRTEEPTTGPGAAPHAASGYNPYAMTPGMAMAGAAPAPRKGELVIQKANIDRIISATTAIFTARWQPLVLGGLIAFAFAFVGGIAVGLGSIFIIGQDPNVTLAINVALQVLLGLMSYYFYLGLVRICLSVARREQASPAQVFAPPHVIGRAWMPVLILVLIGASSHLALLVIDPAINAAPRGAVGFAGLIPALAAMGTGLLVALVLLVTWPFLYLAADERASNFSAVALGFRIATTNLANSFLFALIGIVLNVGAACTCGLASIVTQPVMILIGTVGYLMMTGQDVAEE